MIKWIRTNRLSIKNSLYPTGGSISSDTSPHFTSGLSALQGYLAHEKPPFSLSLAQSPKTRCLVCRNPPMSKDSAHVRAIGLILESLAW
jgi:hypothetical protein